MDRGFPKNNQEGLKDGFQTNTSFNAVHSNRFKSFVVKVGVVVDVVHGFWVVLLVHVRSDLQPNWLCHTVCIIGLSACDQGRSERSKFSGYHQSESGGSK
jgi:hypothetical protein